MRAFVRTELGDTFLSGKQSLLKYYRVIETRAEPGEREILWQHEEMCFLFLLENTATKKGKHLANFDCQNYVTSL